ncbi:hypothetical protein [endosymbiont GvMRE of Glomus versiforme]|uniref:hypothetical protein n=1 Tax=endosymbiont GvMRE of Glomus versiforme TaxID=2039283 RepID=UPI000EDF282F|nr:hypothetical protein [endosymbiont GvMRE of Glomus versiforme]RHZ36423.1 hypothetical protein GvMRE_Ic1g94 [endosymbiont GvMRE of Glomus versiforme]
MNQLTNQELLEELDQRIKEGTITFKQSELVSNPLTSWLTSKNIALAGLVLVTVYLFLNRITAARTNVQIAEADKPFPVYLVPNN